MRLLEVDHEPGGWPAVKMSEISALCNLVENAVPAIDLLQARFELGQKLAMQDGMWWLFDKEGESVVSGKTLRDVLLNLIWVDC